MSRRGALARLALILGPALALGACGRVGFDPAPPQPLCDWRDGTPSFAPVTALPSPISVPTASEIDPSVDGRGNLWFASDRAGSEDLYVARALADGAFAAPELASDLDLGPDAADASVSFFDRLGVAVHSAAPSGATEGLYASVLDGTSGAYGAPVRFEPGGAALQRHLDPFLAPDVVSDRLVLAWAPEHASGRQRIHLASRPLSSAFAPTFEDVEELPLGGDGGDAGDDSDPSLDVSLTTIVFTSTRGGATALWYATRPDADAAFGTPQPLPDLVPGDDRDAFLDPDGCTLWLVGGDGDLYRAAVER